MPTAALYIYNRVTRSIHPAAYRSDRINQLVEMIEELRQAEWDADGLIRDLRMDTIQKRMERRRLQNELAEFKYQEWSRR